jgi:hypothetical protein
MNSSNSFFNTHNKVTSQISNSDLSTVACNFKVGTMNKTPKMRARTFACSKRFIKNRGAEY